MHNVLGPKFDKKRKRTERIVTAIFWIVGMGMCVITAFFTWIAIQVLSYFSMI